MSRWSEEALLPQSPVADGNAHHFQDATGAPINLTHIAQAAFFPDFDVPALELDDSTQSLNRHNTLTTTSSDGDIFESPATEGHHSACSESYKHLTRRLQGWRFGVACAAAASGIVLITNSILAIVLAIQLPHQDGISTIYTGDCNLVGNWSNGIHIVINILSSMLLSASNYTMQCIASPSRAEIDKAHSQGVWLDAGIPSLRNVILGRIAKRRIAVWWCLCLSSLPIHFVYNSAIFKSIMTVNPIEIHMAASNILNGKPATAYDRWDDTPWPSECLSSGYVSEYGCWDNGTTDVCNNYTADDWSGPKWNNSASYFCIDAYFRAGREINDVTIGNLDPGIAILLPGATNVTFNCSTYDESANLPGNEGSTFNCSSIDDGETRTFVQRLTRSENIPESRKIENLTNTQCISAYSKRYITDRSIVVLITSDLKGRDNIGVIYSFPFPMQDEQAETSRSEHSSYNWICRDTAEKFCDENTLSTLQSNPASWTVGGFRIDYCLSMAIPQQCNLQASFLILIIVVACGMVKTAAMIWTLFALGDAPLVTIGDVAMSFLLLPASSSTVTARGPVGSGTCAKSRKWSAPGGLVRWRATVALISTFLLIATGLLAYSARNLSEAADDAEGTKLSPFSFGWSTLNTYAFFSFDYNSDWTGTNFLICMVLLVNLPQVICSLLYFSYNYLLTTMLLSREWCQFYLTKKPLRTSAPQGAQRSTHFLTIPYRYGIPLIVASTTLHWLISQSFFLVRLGSFPDTAWTILHPKPTDGPAPESMYHRMNESQFESRYETIIESRPVYSCPPMLCGILLGLAMLLVLIGMGNRRLPGRMHLAGSSTLAIAAACQRPESDVNAAYLPVSWGELKHKHPDDECHCCFTSGEVLEPCAEFDLDIPIQSKNDPSLFRVLLKRLWKGKRPSQDSNSVAMVDIGGASEDSNSMGIGGRS